MIPHHQKTSTRAHVLDLALFLATMFLIRAFTIPWIGFIANALVNSIVTVGVATWRLKIRGESWKSLGLRRPENYWKMLGVVPVILIGVIISVIVIELIGESISISTGSSENADTRFQEIKGNLTYFFSIIFFVWIESFLEELQDRGFLLTRLEGVFSKIPWSVAWAVIGQAAIFGFRHSPTHGISGAIVTSTIGLILGIAYVVFGRNLWPLILAHCFLNTMSMVERL